MVPRSPWEAIWWWAAVLLPLILLWRQRQQQQKPWLWNHRHVRGDDDDHKRTRLADLQRPKPNHRGKGQYFAVNNRSARPSSANNIERTDCCFVVVVVVVVHRRPIHRRLFGRNHCAVRVWCCHLGRRRRAPAHRWLSRRRGTRETKRNLGECQTRSNPRCGRDRTTNHVLRDREPEPDLEQQEPRHRQQDPHRTRKRNSPRMGRWHHQVLPQQPSVPFDSARPFDAIESVCNVLQPYAQLEVCLVDNTDHGTVLPRTAMDLSSIVPKCRHRDSFRSSTVDDSSSSSGQERGRQHSGVCYILDINCAPATDDECAEMSATKPVTASAQSEEEENQRRRANAAISHSRRRKDTRQ